MKVVKFGGSSLATAHQLKKVLSIIKQDNERRFVIVSAPGKRFADDVKVTDLLISYADLFLESQAVTEIQKQLISRFKEISDDLALSTALLEIESHLTALTSMNKEDAQRVMDAFKAAGENSMALLMAEYLGSQGIPAKYINPKEAGIVVTDMPGDAMVLPESYQRLAKLKQNDFVSVIPGFFGYTIEGNLCTFSRGGSDVSGSIIAAGVNADLYENFTDVDAIYAANPSLVPNCQEISQLTFREMRELSYSGFSVLHDEALAPAFAAMIPVVIKNTNNPSAPGTLITATRESNESVVGIAADSGFTSIYISKYLMNRQIGFGSKVLSILQHFHLRYDHMPSGIDDITVILRKSQLTEDLQASLLDELQRVLEPDELKVTHDLSMLAIVGEGMKQNIGVAAKATTALAEHRVNIDMINQGSSEVSILFAIQQSDETKAVNALYNAFFH